MFDFAASFASIPHSIAVLLISMLPVAELRAAIPIGISSYGMSWPAALGWSLLGNIFIVAVLLWVLGPVSSWLMRVSTTMRRFFDWLFARTRRRVSTSFERWGALALLLFVAIPLPMTGGWTGAVAAFIFGIPKAKSLLIISLGVFIAGIIVTVLTVGVSAILG